MPQDVLEEIREFVRHLLDDRGVSVQPGDDDSLFLTGHLDSMAAIELITRLETRFGVDFSRLDFDVALIDTIADIHRLAQQHKAA